MTRLKYEAPAMPMGGELPCGAQSQHATPTKHIAFVGALAEDWADKSYDIEPEAYEERPPRSNRRSLVALGLRHVLLLILALAVAGAPAQARQLRHLGDEANARADEERSQEHGRPTAFAAFINEMPHACDEQAEVFRTPPPESIVQAARLSDDQRAALEQVRTSTDSAAKTLDANCPKRIPTELGAKLDTLDQALSLVADSLSGLRPGVLKFYALLDDEQKGRLVAMRFSSNPAFRSSGKDSASGSGANAAAKSICTQWVANLSNWPVRQIDAGMQLSNAQRAALYEMSAAIYRLGGQDCPADNPITALGRLDATQNELQAVRRDIEAMRPSITAFENALNAAQRKVLTVAFIDDMIHACGGQAAVLRKLPPETLVQALSDDQRAALEQVRISSDSAAKTLDANCPKRIPAELGAKLDMLDQALSLVADSLSGLRPGILKFYALLDDEQKGRLVAMRFSGNPASRSSGKDSAAGSGANAEAKSICTQWVANLSNWPVKQIDAGMQLSNAQRAALYELSAAIYRLGGQDCPAGNPVTVLGRLDARQNELQAVRRDIEAMRPSVTAFENALNDAQKKNALTLSVPSRGQGSAATLPETFAAPSPLAPW